MRAFSLASLLLSACGVSGENVGGGNGLASPLFAATSDMPFEVQELAVFDEPWAMTFLPNGLLLISEKRGRIRFLDLAPSTPRAGTISGVPKVDYGEQGGLGDIVPHPNFAQNGLLYLSYVEADPNDTRGAVVARAHLVFDEADSGRLENLQILWKQEPKVEGRNHYSHRIAFSPDGYLYITSGERQKFTPAQDLNQNLGKIIRLTDTGGIPNDNPFRDKGRIAAQIWSLGHRNLLGIAFDPTGRLWTHEMGPQGGDEFNLIERGANYGYPNVSNGSHYGGKDIPDHDTRPEYKAPKIYWNPSISPAGLIIYSGSMFPQWQGDALMGALSGKALIHIDIQGSTARQAAKWDMGRRIREVEQGADGAVYLLEDERKGSGGRLLKLTPRRRP